MVLVVTGRRKGYETHSRRLLHCGRANHLCAGERKGSCSTRAGALVRPLQQQRPLLSLKVAMGRTASVRRMVVMILSHQAASRAHFAEATYSEWLVEVVTMGCSLENH